MITVDRLCLEEARGPWEEVTSLAYRHDVVQSYDWARYETEVSGKKPLFLVVRRNGSAIGGLLLCKRTVFRLLRGCEADGGPLAVEGYEEDVLRAVLECLQDRSISALYTMLRPRDPCAAGHVLEHCGFSRSGLHTILIDLSTPESEIWSRLERSARDGVKKGQRRGVEVREALDWAQWAEFGSLQEKHSREKGTFAAVSEKALRFFHDQLLPSGHCRLLLGVLDNRCVSGMLFAIHRTAMLFCAGASDLRYLSASPNDPVMWEAIRWGCQNGIQCLDLNDTDPRENSPLYGIHRFKAKWGGELVERPFYVRGKLYLWVRERLRDNGLVRQVANTVRARRWA